MISHVLLTPYVNTFYRMLLMIQMEYMTLPLQIIPRTDTTTYTPVRKHVLICDEDKHSLSNYVCIPFHLVDHSRVILSVPDGWGSDYINASYINVSSRLQVDNCIQTTDGTGFISSI